MQEVLVELLLCILREDAGDTGIVELRTASTTQHLQHVCQIHIFVSFGFGVEELRAFDNNKMGR